MLRVLGIEESAISSLWQQKQVKELCRCDVTLDEVAHVLSRALQSSGRFVSEKQVRSALDEAVQMTSSVLGVQIVEVRDGS